MTSRNEVFISYKSEDAETVRDVVEILRANGVKCWFAEYSISLHDWLTAVDTEIDQLLEQAILQSRHILVFSSDDWHGSKWCTGEHDRALSHRGVDNITIVRLSPSSADFRFRAPPHAIFDFKDDDPHGLCLFLSKRLNQTISLPKGPSPLGRTALLTNGPFALSLCCSPLHKSDWGFIRFLSGYVQDVWVKCAIAFHPRRTTGVVRGLNRGQLAALAAARTSPPNADSQPIDRIIYREYAQRAAAAGTASGMRIFGLHLLKNPPRAPDDGGPGLEGTTAFGISRVQQTAPNSFVLGRDYSVRLDNGPQQPIGELLLLFEIDVHCATEEQATMQLSHLAPYFDRVAASARYHGTQLDFVRNDARTAAIVHYVLLWPLCILTVSWLDLAPVFSFTAMMYSLIGLGGLEVILRVLREILSRRFLWPTFQIAVKDN